MLSVATGGRGVGVLMVEVSEIGTVGIASDPEVGTPNIERIKAFAISFDDAAFPRVAIAESSLVDFGAAGSGWDDPNNTLIRLENTGAVDVIVIDAGIGPVSAARISI
jgi:hypothetical protein